jgi:heat shock protein HtpX
MKNIYEVAASNKRKSWFVIIGFVVFVTFAIYIMSNAFGLYLGYRPGGLGIAGMAFIISGLMSIGSYYWSDKIVLGISGARPADPRHDREFYSVAENLSLGSGIPMPKLYIIEDTAPNAFATGRDPKHAAIAATTGLLQKLTRTELEGVIAHELSHVRNYDTRLMCIVSVLVGSVALLADFLLRASWFGGGDRDRDKGQLGAILMVVGIVFAILSPIIAQLIQLAISRRREFMADSGAVSMTRQPGGMISALQKIAGDHEPLEVANKATAHLYFESPFKDKSKSAVGWFAGLFNTHPPVSERIKALQQMA